MKATISIYDKWLHTLGGGEVVTCYMAKILRDNGFDVTLLCGKQIPVSVIKDKLGIDLRGVKIVEVWNDEVKLKRLVEDKDFFINSTFMDFTLGWSKKNIYYTYFPKRTESSLALGKLKDLSLIYVSKFFKQVEVVSKVEITELKHGQIAHLFRDSIKLAVSYLEQNKKYSLKFSIFLENFSKSLLNNLEWELQNAQLLKKEVKIDQDNNLVEFNIGFKAFSSTIYLIIDRRDRKHFSEVDRTYLLSPRVITLRMPYLFYKVFLKRVNDRLSAGIFLNIKNRIDTYQTILVDSDYASKWIKSYWGRDAKVLYPPVEMLFKKYDIKTAKKKNYITSVGRFFTAGHSKRQDVLVRAFKKLYDLGYKDWQLHLVGGLSDDKSSLEYVKKLKKMSKGFPIYFHFNASRKKVEDLLIKTKIYWHATGFGEDKQKSPEKLEHFGIAPIEAISAGCTPLLFDGGGLRETIEKLNFSEENLFNSFDQLVEATKKLIKKDQFVSFKKYFPLVEENFSVAQFEERLLEIIRN